MTNKITFFCYPRCSTCKKAEVFLNNHNINFDFRDIKLSNPTFEELEAFSQKTAKPLRSLFNTSGILYKDMGLKEKLPNMTDVEMLELLSTDGMLVKRPLLILNDKVLIGFKEDEWRVALNIL